MSHTILLYGATGFSGRLIAQEARRAGMSDVDRSGELRMILAGRDGEALARVANECGMDSRPFALDDRETIARNLHGVDVVLNAAGPFAETGCRLVAAALEQRCHYVDINGEVDVYRQLDDYSYLAERLHCVLVSGAGTTAAASDILLDSALAQLPREAGGELGAVRIASKGIASLSRGSVETAWRSLREQVTLIRANLVRDGDRGYVPELVPWHEPAGMRERTFDFGRPTEGGEQGKAVPSLAAAANLVDTLTARLTLLRNGAWAHDIESYVEVGSLARFGYPLAATLAPLSRWPGVTPLVTAQMGLLPEEPAASDLANHSVVLQIEDRFHTRVVDWRWETPDVYQFTAQLAVAVATRVVGRSDSGWRTPAEVLGRAEIVDRGAGKLTLRLGYDPTPDPLRGSALVRSA